MARISRLTPALVIIMLLNWLLIIAHAH